jgi:hypothetical protein
VELSDKNLLRQVLVCLCPNGTSTITFGTTATPALRHSCRPRKLRPDPASEAGVDGTPPPPHSELLGSMRVCPEASMEVTGGRLTRARWFAPGHAVAVSAGSLR